MSKGISIDYCNIGLAVAPTMYDLHSGVMRVPHDKCKLDALVPVIGRLIIESVFQVHGSKVDIIAIWEKQNSPSWN